MKQLSADQIVSFETIASMYKKSVLMAMPVQSLDHSVCRQLVYRPFSLKDIQLKLVEDDRSIGLPALNLVLICKTR